ncbi:MAG: ABC transporter ATP-binding protein [Treponemataceae bacterium]
MDTYNDIYNEKVKPTKGTFFRLLAYAKPHTFFVVLSLLFMITATSLNNLQPRIIQIAIDEYLTPSKFVKSKNSFTPDLNLRGEKYSRIKNLSEGERKLVINTNTPQFSFRKVNGDFEFYQIENTNFEPIKLSREEYNSFRKKDYQGLKKMSLYFIIIILGTSVFNIAQSYILSMTSQKIVFKIRSDLFSHIESRSLSYFDKNPIGKLVTRVTNDTESLNEMYINILVGSISQVFAIISVMFMMLNLNVRIALMSFSVIPFIFLFAIIFRKHIRVINRLVKSQIGKINSSLNEYITGMKIVQIFAREKKVYKHFDKLNSGYLRLTKRAVFLRSIFRPSVEILRSVAIAVLIYFAAGDVIKGVIEFGVFYAFTEYVGRFFNPVLELTETFDIIQDAMASSERIFNILDDKTEIKDPENPKVLKDVKGKIEFRNVSFSYDGVTKVLNNISFTIMPGQFFAFVGETGSGKSTIMNLITRMYDLEEGEILIDDVNIKDLRKEDLRKIVATVQQDVFIFTGTIRDNIVLENKSISDEEMKAVAEYVNASKFIEKLPQKYDEPVMERGVTLSNGERQLLSFARTLAAKPSILILDEATSSIDTEMEVLIQDALEKILHDHTSISVAHRLSTIQHADKIIVMRKGEIAEAGTHEELLQKRGIYYRLYELQFQEI